MTAGALGAMDASDFEVDGDYLDRRGNENERLPILAKYRSDNMPMDN